jgi:hypothetical protein
MTDSEDDNAGEGSSRSLPAPRTQTQPSSSAGAAKQAIRTQGTNLPEEKEIKLNKGIKLLLDSSNLAR